MDEGLGPLTATRKTGQEPFLAGGRPLDFKLLEFWQWMGSDLIGNTFRGAVAEYLVARALGIAAGTRDEWGAFDLRTRDGLKIEVKSCAYLQSWWQRGPSTVLFGVRPTRAWDPETGTFAPEVRRQADVYVFALLKHREKATLDPLDVEQWEFFVLSTAILDARLPSGCRQISLRSLMHLGPRRASYVELASAVRNVTSPVMAPSA
jgi:hypothetical protein